MKKQVKDKWVAALLGGEYKQTRGYLRTSEGFCCLGVLCDLASKEGVGHWGEEGEEIDSDIETTNSTAKHFVSRIDRRDSTAWTLPNAVRIWAGMLSHTGDIFDTDLAKENDSGRTFEDLACVIEGNWERL